MDPFIGQIMAVGFGFNPRGWANCDGQLISIASNNALFALLGTTFGGDGRTTFALPDLRGRSIVGQGSGPGLSTITWGERGGSETTTLIANNLPAHTHPVAVPVSGAAGEESTANGNYIAGHAGAFNEDATAGQNLASFNSGNNTTTNSSFNNRSPFLGMFYIIALQGIFPSRN